MSGRPAEPHADLARELMADLLLDAAQHPPPGHDPDRCRRLARVLRADDAPARAVQAATDAALALASADGPHRWAWRFWAAKNVPGGDLRRWHARQLVKEWTEETTR